jgi:hypothetical protein
MYACIIKLRNVYGICVVILEGKDHPEDVGFTGRDNIKKGP